MISFSNMAVSTTFLIFPQIFRGEHSAFARVILILTDSFGESSNE
jgi:hypothetical protein